MVDDPGKHTTSNIIKAAADPSQVLVEVGEACSCWHIIDRNEGRSGTIRYASNPDCLICKGTGIIPALEVRP